MQNDAGGRGRHYNHAMSQHNIPTACPNSSWDSRGQAKVPPRLLLASAPSEASHEEA